MTKLTDEQIDLVDVAVYLVDEEFVETRKGVPQTRYIVEVRQEDVWDGEDFKPVPQELVGLWMQQYPNDNTMISWQERLGTARNDQYKCPFIKAKSVQVVTVTYEADE